MLNQELRFDDLDLGAKPVFMRPAGRLEMVRAEGIEPSIQAWEAHVLPLYYARKMPDNGIRSGKERDRADGREAVKRQRDSKVENSKVVR